MTKKIITVAAALLLAMPVVTMAAAFAPPVPAQYTGTIYTLIGDIIFPIIWVGFVTFAIIMFIMAAVQFFTAQGDPGKVADARNFVIWGAVGMAVALLAFSMPFIIARTIGV